LWSIKIKKQKTSPLIPLQRGNKIKNFLGLPEENSSFEGSNIYVLPVPFEATVTYGKGTAAGPEAIIDASHQVEFYDREFRSEPAMEFGIHTLPAAEIQDTPKKTIESISKEVLSFFDKNKLLVGLGGEHSITLGLVSGINKILDRAITIVQIDAHCDLRNEYEGSIYNHACVACRLLEIGNVEKILQLGIRSISKKEIDFINNNPEQVRTWFSENVHSNSWQEEFIKEISGKNVYLTIDVDGLDPGTISATGTPEPDGLSWKETLDIIRLASKNSNVVGFDCVELAPVPGQHASDYAAAKLVYKTICLIKKSKLEIKH